MHELLHSITWKKAKKFAPPALSKEIFIYKKYFNDKQDYHAFDDILSAQEKERVARFMFAKDKVSYAVSYGSLREILGAMLKIPPGEIVLTRGTMGKPYVSQKQNSLHLQFNMTHTEGCILIAVGIEHELGVDIENQNRTLEHLSIAESYFHNKEYEFLTAQSLSEQQKCFFYLWTRKEAYTKAIGLGLRYALEKFSVVNALEDENQVVKWHIHSFAVDETFIGAVVTAKENVSLKFYEL